MMINRFSRRGSDFDVPGREYIYLDERCVHMPRPMLACQWFFFPEFTSFCRDTMTLARWKYWQIKTNFTAPLLYNHILKSYPKDYKYNKQDFFTCLAFL